METITSKTNPLCTHFRKLASSRSYREKTGEFLCDSPKLLEEAKLWDAPVLAVLYTEGAALPWDPEGLVRRSGWSPTPMAGCGIWYWTAFRTPAMWARCSGRRTPSGPR